MHENLHTLCIPAYVFTSVLWFVSPECVLCAHTHICVYLSYSNTQTLRIRCGQFLSSWPNSLLTITAGLTFSHSASVGFSLIGCSSSGWDWSCKEGDTVSFGLSCSSPTQPALSWPITSASSGGGWKGGVARMEDIILGTKMKGLTLVYELQLYQPGWTLTEVTHKQLQTSAAVLTMIKTKRYLSPARLTPKPSWKPWCIFCGKLQTMTHQHGKIEQCFVTFCFDRHSFHNNIIMIGLSLSAGGWLV